MTHFHTAYGFPKHGLHWTEDEHETTGAAWAAVGLVVGENWRDDKARIYAFPEHYSNVKDAYARADALCDSGHLPAGTSFEIPSLDSDKDAMVYGVVECGDVHLQAVS